MHNDYYREIKELNKMREENRSLRQSIKILSDELNKRKKFANVGSSLEYPLSSGNADRPGVHNETLRDRDVERRPSRDAPVVPAINKNRNINIRTNKERDSDDMVGSRRRKWEMAREMFTRFADAMRMLFEDEAGTLKKRKAYETDNSEIRREDKDEFRRPRLVSSLAENTPASSSEAGGLEAENWSEVVKRNKRRRIDSNIDKRNNLISNRNNNNNLNNTQRTPRPSRRKPRAPSPNLVTISIVIDEGGPSYAFVLGKTKESVSKEDLAGLNTRVKRALSGGVLLEIRGDDL